MSLHTAFLQLYWEKSLSRLYTDQLVKSHKLNTLLINGHKLFAYIHNNAINHTFMSQSTLRWRKVYMESRAECSRLELEETRATFSRDNFTLANTLINNSTKDKTNPNQRDSHLKLSLSKRNNTIFALFLAVEVLLCFRYFLNLSFYSTLARTEQKICCTNQLYGLYQARGRPISVASLLNITDRTSNASLKDDECRRSYEQMANLFSEQFGGFLLWDKHVARINNSFIKRWFLLENEEPLQLLGPEVKVVMRSVSVFILVCGILSGLLFVWRPFDIPYMVFITEPGFCAFRLHYKLHAYLDAMRYSYMNYISNIRLHSESHAHKEFEWANPESGGVKKPSIVDDLSLSYSKFCDYLPGARRQSWRKVLMINHTWMAANVNILGFLVIFLVCYYQISLNKLTIQLNSELETLLLEGQPDARLIFTQPPTSGASGCTIGTNTLSHLDDRLADSLMEYARRTGTNVPWHKLRGNMSSREFIASRIGPLKEVDARQWLLVGISNMNLVILAAAYIVAFILSIVDLSVWLIELQMKLRTCALLVEYIQSANYLYQDDTADFTRNPLNLLSRDQDYNTMRDSSRNRPRGTEIEQCSFKTQEVFQYLLSTRPDRMKTCKERAMRVITLDRFDTLGQRRATECFIYSTYLDIRLFENEIDLCRPIINYSITYAVFEALILAIEASPLANTWIKFGILLFSFTLSNSFLLLASFFESQCSKLIGPIFSILSMGLNSDKRLQHMALLWRKYLNDLTGTHSKFVFRLFSFKVTYATTIQFNLSLASLIVIIAGSADPNSHRS